MFTEANSPFAPPRLILHRNACVMPVGKGHFTGARVWHGGGLYLEDGFADPWLTDHMGNEAVGVADRGLAVREHTEVLFGGLMKACFGHFLVESIARLWALDRLGSGIPVVFVSGAGTELDPGPTATQFFRLVNLKNPVVLVKSPTVFDRIWNADCLYDPMLGRPLQEHLRQWIFSRMAFAALPQPPEPTFGRKLYVTRSGLKQRYGRFLGETAVESGLKDEGYQVFLPERHSLEDQISAYRQAETIVLAESSAVHLMSIFCSDSIRVAMIRRRPQPPGGMRTAVESFRSRDIHLVSAFKAVWDVPGVKRPGMSVSELDFGRLWGALRSAGFVDRDHDKPIPSDGEVADERVRIAPDRTCRTDLGQ